MDWIKRNLYFVIGGALGLLLLGLAGWYVYSKWQLNNQVLGKLNEEYATLADLNRKTPHPGSGDVDNIKAAKEQQQQLRAVMGKSRAFFQRITPIPDAAKVGDQDFSFALSRTIALLQRDATNASVSLPPTIRNFSFQAQKDSVQFTPGSLDPLAVQLGEVKAICDILFQAKINALDGLQRERVSADDAKGPQSDYLEQKSVTNELAVLSPYRLTFHCFTPELASVLSGFASSPYGLLVKTIDVEKAQEAAPSETPMVAAAAPVVPVPAPVATPPTPAESGEAAFARRYGLRPGNPSPLQNYTPSVPAAQAPAPAAKPTVAVVIDERPLKVTLLLNVVKLAAQK